VRLRRIAFLALLTVCVVLIARVSERHEVIFDVTAQRNNSLSMTADQALNRLGPGLEFIAFVPEFPVQRLQMERQLAPYLSHATKPRLRYIDPLAAPDQAAALDAQHQGELHLLFGDRREIIVAPDRARIDQALNRLGLRGERWIVSLIGHGEMRIDNSPGGIGKFAERLERLGYRVVSLDPRRLDRLPDNAAVLLLAAPQQPYDRQTAQLIKNFTASGGRLLWLDSDPNSTLLGNQFGIHRLPGVVVDANAARFGLDSPAHAIVEDFPPALLPQTPAQPATLYRASALDIRVTDGWRSVATLRSSAMSWNETGELTGRLRHDANLGEQTGPLTLAVALERDNAQTPAARVVYLGSPHVMRNAQIGQLGNSETLLGLVHWLTENTALITTADAPDTTIRWSPAVGGSLAIVLMGVLPIVYLGIGILLRMRRRRASA